MRSLTYRGEGLVFISGRMTRAQGAMDSTRKSSTVALSGQGATEYLVLLAVVLIVALVAIALLSSQTETISETKFAQNQLLWKSQTPVSISASAGYKYPYNTDLLVPYIEITNTGTDPIRLSTVYSGSQNISYYQTSSVQAALTNVVISPGDSICFGTYPQCIGVISIAMTNSDSFCMPVGSCLRALTSNCLTGGAGFARASIGFNYDVLVHGQSVSKKQDENEILFQCGGCAYYAGTTGTMSCGTG